MVTSPRLDGGFCEGGAPLATACVGCVAVVSLYCIGDAAPLCRSCPPPYPPPSIYFWSRRPAAARWAPKPSGWLLTPARRRELWCVGPPRGSRPLRSTTAPAMTWTGPPGVGIAALRRRHGGWEDGWRGGGGAHSYDPRPRGRSARPHWPGWVQEDDGSGDGCWESRSLASAEAVVVSPAAPPLCRAYPTVPPTRAASDPLHPLPGTVSFSPPHPCPSSWRPSGVAHCCWAHSP